MDLNVRTQYNNPTVWRLLEPSERALLDDPTTQQVKQVAQSTQEQTPITQRVEQAAQSVPAQAFKERALEKPPITRRVEQKARSEKNPKSDTAKETALYLLIGVGIGTGITALLAIIFDKCSPRN